MNLVAARTLADELMKIVCIHYWYRGLWEKLLIVRSVRDDPEAPRPPELDSWEDVAVECARSLEQMRHDLEVTVEQCRTAMTDLGVHPDLQQSHWLAVSHDLRPALDDLSDACAQTAEVHPFLGDPPINEGILAATARWMSTAVLCATALGDIVKAAEAHRVAGDRDQPEERSES